MNHNIFSNYFNVCMAEIRGLDNGGSTVEDWHQPITTRSNVGFSVLAKDDSTHG